MTIGRIRQIKALLKKAINGGISRKSFQALLSESKEVLANPEPTIIPIEVSVDYSRTLVQMRDSGRYDICSDDLNDENFPIETGQSGKKILVLVGFNRIIDDSENPAESELLRELDRLDLEPAGPAELCAFGEKYPKLPCGPRIVARRQVWQPPGDDPACPVFHVLFKKRIMIVISILVFRWDPDDLFLASFKRK